MPRGPGLCPSFTARDDHVAPDALRRRIGENDVAGPIGHRNAHRQCGKDQAQKFLAFADHLLRPLAGGEVERGIKACQCRALVVPLIQPSTWYPLETGIQASVSANRRLSSPLTTG